MNILRFLRKPYWSVFMLATFLFSSCTNNDVIESELTQREFETLAIKDSKLSESLRSAFTTKNFKRSSVDNDFNFDQVSEVEHTETGEVAYMIDSNENENVKLGAYVVEHGGYDFLIVEYKTDSPTKEIIYSNLNGEVVLKVLADTATEQITTERPTKDGINRSADEDPGCGQKTADCLADAYTNNGWTSVGLWIVTGFYPAFGIGAAIGCAAAVC